MEDKEYLLNSILFSEILKIIIKPITKGIVMPEKDIDITGVKFFKFEKPGQFIEGKTLGYYNFQSPAILLNVIPENKDNPMVLVGLTSGLKRMVKNAILNEDLNYDTHIKITFTHTEKVDNGLFMHFALDFGDNKIYTTEQTKPLTLKSFSTLL